MTDQRDDALALTADARDALGRAALDWCRQYLDAGGIPPLYPSTSADALRSLLGEPLPRQPQNAQRVLQQFADIAAHSRKNHHPRMFGYVQSSGSFVGAVGDFLASALNQNVTSWRSAPAATTIELQIIDWIKEMVGFDRGGSGLLLSGGSMANLAGLATALRATTGVDVNQQGVRALSGRPVIYASAMAHMSIGKAAALLGVGREAVRTVPVDGEFRLDVPRLAGMIADDRRAGHLPMCVVGTAGDVNTGAVDPLDALADICAAEQLWLHVDAAYGGFAALAPSAARLLRGLARADSVALDPHKWLYAPLDAGCLLVRDPSALRRAFSSGAAYVDVIADRDMSEFAFWDYGPELSRRFRALKIWFVLKCHGADALAASIERNLATAKYLAEAIDAAPDFDRLAPAPLSIVCFRYLPPHLTDASNEGLNAFNRDLLLQVQRDGDSYLSNAMIGDVFALRACIVNHQTTDADADRLLETIRRVALMPG